MDRGNENETTKTPEQEKKDRENIRRIQRNMQRSEMNKILRDFCGTSAKAAREDMGLSKY